VAVTHINSNLLTPIYRTHVRSARKSGNFLGAVSSVATGVSQWVFMRGAEPLSQVCLFGEERLRPVTGAPSPTFSSARFEGFTYSADATTLCSPIARFDEKDLP
jgi:hypothetical protein